MPSAGALLASGRDSDIFEYGPGLVLRRARDGRSLESEGRTMDHVRRHGYPVPAVQEATEGGTALVMERIDGPSMVQQIIRRPWTMGSQARLLADLHTRLHAIEAAPWLPPAPGPRGRSLLHLDLHPLNVILSARGPVVIDWPNARRGDPAADIAMTWVLLDSGAIPAPAPLAAVLARFRSRFVRSFLAAVDVEAARRLVPTMVADKLRDRNMSEVECAAMRRLARSTTRT